jgi:hypothetical protein
LTTQILRVDNVNIVIRENSWLLAGDTCVLSLSASLWKEGSEKKKKKQKKKKEKKNLKRLASQINSFISRRPTEFPRVAQRVYLLQR